MLVPSQLGFVQSPVRCCMLLYAQQGGSEQALNERACGTVPYMQAKAGVVGLSKTVAREWGAFNIRCNAIAYGFIATRLTASKDDGASISVNGEKVRKTDIITPKLLNDTDAQCYQRRR